MMTSKAMKQAIYNQAYVWVWLPDSDAPVVAGVLTRQGRQLVFNYGRSYLERSNAMALYAPELPLVAGAIPLLPGMDMPSCIRDASPDAWGRRVLINRKFGLKGVAAADAELDELTYLLESGSDRVGALDFQVSPTQYVARQPQKASLDDLFSAADKVAQGLPLAADLGQALQHGTSLGGARPKVLLDEFDSKWIAKFSASNDLYNVVKAEYIAMRLAAKVGLNVANVQLTTTLGKDVLLIERFDRVRHQGGWHRRAMVSALTLLGLDEMMAAYASYEKLAELVRFRFKDAKATLRELFGRIVFNVLCGNTDDHARNHAAFWDGHQLTLTPAYDICPQARAGEEATQAMLIHGQKRNSQIATCLDAAAAFLLKPDEALAIVNGQITEIRESWLALCNEAKLSEVDRNYFWHRQFLNPYVFYGAPDGLQH
ncbi:HipA domain-containing protein [Limnohabitans sp.]|uniref:type II toxin-antitoxin system HipA family toxin n=1 Tax=Limnohabitans sp. TaxID=1907725 RepID=UPI00286F5EDB|nr:HipA domain-containing protein [Limnohabitans sp.]